MPTVVIIANVNLHLQQMRLFCKIETYLSSGYECLFLDRLAHMCTQLSIQTKEIVYKYQSSCKRKKIGV